MLEVCEVFSSLMGEGPYVGTPCHFVRFSSCNLRCSFCIGIRPDRRIPRIIAGNGPNKKIADVKTGDKLLAMDDGGKLVETEVREVLSRTVDGYYGVKVEGKPWLYLTAEHPIRTNRGWVETRDLRIGDEIIFITPNEKIRFHKKNYNPMFNPEIVKKVSDEDISRSLRNFASNGLKVQLVKKYSPHPKYPCRNPKPLKVYNFKCSPYTNFFVDYLLVHNCDTKYTWERGEQVSAEGLLSQILSMGKEVDTVVLTGGEPLLQEHRSLLSLCKGLKSRGFEILVETNGTIEPGIELLKTIDVWSVSPKLRNSGQEVMYGSFEWLKNTRDWYLKFVIREPSEDVPEVADFLKKHDLPDSRVFLQPANESGVNYLEKSKELARYVLEKKVPFKVVPQLHVLLGLR